MTHQTAQNKVKSASFCGTFSGTLIFLDTPLDRHPHDWTELKRMPQVPGRLATYILVTEIVVTGWSAVLFCSVGKDVKDVSRIIAVGACEVWCVREQVIRILTLIG